MPLLEGILMMNDFTLLVSRSERLTHAREHLNEMFGKKFPKNFRKEHIEYHKDQPEELAVINYTSGTTSYSKGVMLPYRSLWSNTAFAFEVLPLKAGDKIVSMLPMAHMYGLAFEFLYEFAVGCQIQLHQVADIRVVLCNQNRCFHCASFPFSAWSGRLSINAIARSITASPVSPCGPPL